LRGNRRFALDEKTAVFGTTEPRSVVRKKHAATFNFAVVDAVQRVVLTARGDFLAVVSSPVRIPSRRLPRVPSLPANSAAVSALPLEFAA